MSTQENEIDLPDSEVVVKLASCPLCQGIITAAIKHTMTLKDKNKFKKEAFDFNLITSEMPFLQYRDNLPEWCKCY